MDLMPPDLSFETQIAVVEKKTATLFEMSFLLGWIYGGGDHVYLSKLKQAAKHFGLAFQIVDDLEDLAQDLSQDKDQAEKVNLGLLLGKDEAKILVQQEVESYFSILERLPVDTEELRLIGDALLVRV